MQTVRRFFLIVPMVIPLLAGCLAPPLETRTQNEPADEWEVVTSIPLASGVASGDVTDHSARVWFRTSGPAKVEVEWSPVQPMGTHARIEGGDRKSTMTVDAQDFTGVVLLNHLEPLTTYRYTLTAWRYDPKTPRDITQETGSGVFRTAPAEKAPTKVSFVWSGDLGGQKRCRDTWVGYPIFYRMLQLKPDFALLLGDMIYGDDVCPSPPNVPGSEFVAVTLEQFRAKHRYQRGASALQRFLASVPVYVMWDDHEVRNNFSGPGDPLTPAGRQALLDYWPISTPVDEPTRLYRKFRWGADLELFILDTRQYRSPNKEPDGPNKTMLGDAQRQWLLESLSRSTATWKMIVTSVPLSNPKGGTALMPGNDSWARAEDGTGFQTELQTIVNAILRKRIRNVIWLAGDVHYAQVNTYDPNNDGTPDFYEFISGPLSAYPGKPLPPSSAFNPKSLYSDGGFYNFGHIAVAGGELRVQIVDDTGLPRFSRTFKAQ